jgi:hypothetical protein
VIHSPKTTSVTVVFNIALAEKVAQAFMEDFLEYSTDVAAEKDLIREWFIVETCEHGKE